MPRPTVSRAAEQLYGILAPLAYDDGRLDWPLLKYCEALASSLQEVNDYIVYDGYPAWGVVMDVDVAPSKALPWLAQFVGVTVPPQQTGETDEAYDARIRAYIKATPGFDRGTPAAMIAAIQQTLTGSKTVYIRERYGGAYKMEVITITAETPNAAATLRAILSQKPAGIVLTHSVLVGQDFQILFDTHTTFQDVYTDYATMQGVYLDQSGT